MKRILFAFVMCISFFGYSQNNQFKKAWAKIDTLEVNKKIESALAQTDALIRKAGSKKDYNTLLRGKIYRWKFIQLIEENSNNRILAEVNETIGELPYPHNSILETYKAKWLYDYYEQNRWKISNRAQDDIKDKDDINTWDITYLLEQIRKSYRAALQDSERLLQYPLEDFEPILTTAVINRKYRPTLYDLIAHESLAFYDNNFNYVTKPKELYRLNNPRLFAETPQFLDLDLTSNDSIYSKINALKAYQSLEKTNLNGDEPVYVHNVLERLKFVYANYQGKNTWPLYEAALKNLAKKYENKGTAAMVLLELATQYNRMGGVKMDDKNMDKAPYTREEINRLKKIKNGKYLLKYPDYHRRALTLVEQVIKEYPSTAFTQQAAALKKELTNPTLSIRSSKAVASNQAIRFFTEYKAMDSLYLSVYKIEEDQPANIHFKSIQDSSLQAILKRKPVYAGNFFLQKGDDLNNHSTELMIPGLDLGSYLIYATSPKMWPQDRFNYFTLKVTDIDGVIMTFNDTERIIVTDRKSGKPIENLEVSTFRNFPIQSSNLLFKGYTDAQGEIPVPKYHNITRVPTITLQKEGDTTEIIEYASPQYHRDDDGRSLDSISKSLVYIDRAIYRPGQKVYFKGVLLLHYNDTTSVVPNEYVTVYVDDANGNEIQEIRLKTNEYGSVSGEFTLPKTTMTGDFDIYVDEDYEEDSVFWDTAWDFDYQTTSFKVEEYKRPTFEVAFDEIKETYTPGDSVTIRGGATSFMGAKLVELPVAYTINRKQFDGRWYYSATEEVQIANDTIFTDANGDFEIAFKIQDTLSQEKNTFYQYTIDATITDVSGETRSSNTGFKISKNNLRANLMVDALAKIGQELHIKVETINLNGFSTPAKGTIKIYKKIAPSRVVNKRLWQAPEIQTISESDFAQAFPSEPYFDEGDSSNWQIGELVHESTFETQGAFSKELHVSRGWASGEYSLELNVDTEGGASAKAIKTFSIIDPKETKLPDNKVFAYNILNDELSRDEPLQLELLTGYASLPLKVRMYDGQKTIFKKDLELHGKRVLTIPFPESSTNRFMLQVIGFKDGQWITENPVINLPETKGNKLVLGTKTFRNKIRPGLDEQWSFMVKNEDGSTPDAEILASMYDASLDQFTQKDWEKYTGFNRGYRGYDFPHVSVQGNDILNFNKNGNYWFNPNTNSIWTRFDRLYDYGFDFGDPNSSEYRTYLAATVTKRNIKIEGNTKGIVTDENGVPLPGVSVLIKGTDVGTQSNFDGEFGLNTSSGDVLVFSYIGYTDQEVMSNRDNNIHLMLQASNESLDEVVIVGYGVQEKKNLTGAISSVTIENNALNDILAGRVAGVQFSEAEGIAGAPSSIRIRGMSSLTGDKNLLVIVDGMPMELDDLDMNSSNISTINVLKDAAATSLYGARGANGVLIITTKNALEEVAQVETRKNLDETAFFFPHLTANKNGEFSIDFTSPEALTQWKLRLLAHNKKWETGYLENTVVTQKDLSISPNAPRFLREGDKITLKAKVTNLTAEPMNGIAQLQLFDVLTMEPIDDKLGNKKPSTTFTIGAKNSTSVSWELNIPDGVEAVTYKVLAKAGNFTDGEENSLPVLTNSLLITESKSLFVRGGKSQTVTLEQLRDNTSPTLKNHKFTLEYTSNPVWFTIQSLPYLMEFPHECAEQTFARLYANSLGAHILNSNPKIAGVFKAWEENGDKLTNLEKNAELKSIILEETPWLRDAQSDAEKKQRIAQLFDLKKLATEQQEILKKLENQQLDNGAFPWFSGGSPNLFITQHILAGLGHLHKLGVEVDAETLEYSAIQYLDSDLLSRFAQHEKSSRDEAGFYKNPALLHYLYARSFYLKEHPFNEQLSRIAGKTMEFHKTAWSQNSNYKNSLLALIASRMGDKAFAKKILTGLKESAVQSSENGMYWKTTTSSWWWYDAPIETQALIIEAFSEITEDTKTIEELKIWLLQNKRTNSWHTTKSTTEAIYALLLQGEDWLPIANRTKFTVGTEKMDMEDLATTKKETATGYLKKDWDKTEITPAFAKVTVKNNNEQPGYGGVYWQYFENLDKVQPDANGKLSVDKEVFVTTTTGSGKKLKQISTETPIKIGDLVTVRLTLRTDVDMDYVHVKDMRASGLEPTEVLSEYKYQDGTSYYQSTRDAATNFFFDQLKKGTYVVEYTLRANNAGTFSNGITTIENMYAPEFGGHTQGLTVKIDE